MNNNRRRRDNFRIQLVPTSKDKCSLCSEIAMGCHFDHDLAAMTPDHRGHVCNECSGFVIVAEAILRGAHLTVPSDPQLSEPDGPNFESVP